MDETNLERALEDMRLMGLKGGLFLPEGHRRARIETKTARRPRKTQVRGRMLR